MDHGQTKEYMTEKNAMDFQCLLHKYWESYQTKKPDMPDQEWLGQLLCSELSKPRKAKEYARNIVRAADIYQMNITSLQEAVQQGGSTGQWLSEKIQAASVGMAIDEYGRTLRMARDILYRKNIELAGVLQHSRHGDGLSSLALDYAKEEKGIPFYTEAVPSTGYSYYQTKDLILSMEKNISMIALQTAAVTTGLTFAYQGFHGRKRASQKYNVSVLKILIAGILQTAAQKGWLPALPKKMPSSMIASISCAGIENAAVLGQIAAGKIPVMKGIDQMGYHMLSLIGGTWDIAGRDTVETLFLSWKSVLGIPLAVLNGFLEGITGYWHSTRMGDAVYHAGKEAAEITKSIAKSGIKGIRPSGQETNHSKQVVSWIR